MYQQGMENKWKWDERPYSYERIYPKPGQTPPPAGYVYPPMASVKSFNSIPLFLFSVLTGGLYFISAMSIMSDTNNEIAVRVKRKKVLGLTDIINVGLAWYSMMYALWIYGNVMDEKMMLIGGRIGMYIGIPLFLMLTVFWFYLFCKQQCEILSAFGKAPSPNVSPIVLMLLSFVPIYSFFILSENYNTGVSEFETWQKNVIQ